MRLYGEIIPELTTITSVDLAHYEVSCANDWLSVYCGSNVSYFFYLKYFFLQLRVSTF